MIGWDLIRGALEKHTCGMICRPGYKWVWSLGFILRAIGRLWRMRVEANESTQCLSFGHSQALHFLSWRPLIKLEAWGPCLCS